MGSCIAEKIDVARVTIERVGLFTAKASVTSMDAANHVLRKWSHTVLDEGRDKCDFLVVYEDGKTVNGGAADTDTIVASARAYVSALNKLLTKREKSAPAALSA